MPPDVAFSYTTFDGNVSFTVCEAVLSTFSNRLAFTPGNRCQDATQFHCYQVLGVPSNESAIFFRFIVCFPRN